MNESKKLIQQITEGIQDKKGKNIVIADLSKIGDTICNYLVICQVFGLIWRRPRDVPGCRSLSFRVKIP